MTIRLMSVQDVGFANQVRAMAGWNQTFADWARFLAVEPNGCFVAEWDGEPAGTATCTSYGTVLGWIGMLLVHPDHRRHGIGSALLEHCLAYFEGRGIGCVKLDATPLGQPLYQRHGFVPEQSLTRWETEGVTVTAPAGSCALEPGMVENWADWIALDQEAFGVRRDAVITALAGCCAQVVTCRAEADRCAGYGMLRDGTRAQYLGPVSARSAEIGDAMIRHLLGLVPGRAVFWDVLDSNRAAMELAEALGFRRQRPLLRMYRGDNPGVGQPGLQFAIVDPAVG